MVVGEIRERQDNQADGGRSTSKFSSARRVGETLRGQGLATPLILGGWLAVVFILFAEHGRGQEHLPELLEIDGIELDRNAAAKLTGSSGSVGGRRRDASPYPDDATDKMLKQHEAGDLYGVALDKNAAAVLHRARVKSVSSRGREGSSGGTGKVKGGKAQALLERGESELDSERYRSALRDLAKARDDWKGQGRQDWHWAETLVQDVLRSHPELRHHEQEKENAGTARATKAGGKVVSKKWGSDAGSQHGLIKTAAKELASGKQFRSLYGLARDEAARRAGAPEWSPPAESAQGPAALQPSVPGRMSTLSQVPVAARQPSGGEGGDVLQLAVDSAVKAAEKKLQLENHLALLHEEASIRRNAQEILRGQAGPRARVAAKGARIRQQQLRAFLAPRVAFSQKVSPSAATVRSHSFF